MKNCVPHHCGNNQGEITSVEQKIKHNYFLKNIIDDLISLGMLFPLNKKKKTTYLYRSEILSVTLTVSNVTMEVIIDMGAEITLNS